MRLEISQEASQECWSQQRTKWVNWSQFVVVKGEKLAAYTYQQLSTSDATDEMKPNLEVYTHPRQ